MRVRWRQPLMRGSLLVMESLWVYALVAFLIAITVGGDRPTILGTTAVVFVSYGISRLLQNTVGSLFLLRLWGIVLSLLAFYVIVRLDFFGDGRLWDFSWADAVFNHTEATLRDKATAVIAIPVLWLFWMRGILRGQQTLIFETVIGSFAIGVIVFAVVLVFAPAVDAPSAIGYASVPYIAAGLLAISLAHAARADDDFDRSFTSTWVIAIGGAIGLTAIAGILFVVIDYGALRSALGDVSLQLTTWMVQALAILSWPLEQLFNGLFKAIYFLAHLYGGTRNEQQQAPQEGLTDEEKPDPSGSPPDWLRLLARLIIGGGFVTIVLFGLFVLFAMYRKQPRTGEVKESTYQDGRLGADLGNMMGALLGRLRPSFNRNASNDPIRRLYTEVLTTAAERGVERRPPETPLELSPRLGQTFARSTTDRITAAYDEVRYGAVSPSEPEVRTLRDDWNRAKENRGGRE